MKQFEYKIVYISGPWKAMNERLNRYGLEGFELVSVYNGFAYLKKEVETKPEEKCAPHDPCTLYREAESILIERGACVANSYKCANCSRGDDDTKVTFNYIEVIPGLRLLCVGGARPRLWGK